MAESRVHDEGKSGKAFTQMRLTISNGGCLAFKLPDGWSTLDKEWRYTVKRNRSDRSREWSVYSQNRAQMKKGETIIVED